MTAREYAKKVGIKVIGKLTRHPEWEYEENYLTGGKKWSGVKSYCDEGGNVYHVGKKGVCIVTTDDCVI